MRHLTEGSDFLEDLTSNGINNYDKLVDSDNNHRVEEIYTSAPFKKS